MKRKAIILTVTLILILIFSMPALAKRDHPERWYQNQWCNEHNGQTEVVFKDRTRCDCLTATHAIEFDFGNKWAEAIGQSLYYGLQTGKRPGIVLILEDEKDYKYWIRLNSVIDNYKLPIDAWKIGKGGN